MGTVKRSFLILLIFLLPGSLVSQIALGQQFPAATTAITVNTTADIVDIAGKTCADITTADLPGADGLVSLREALCASNNTPDGNTHEIAFQIGSGVQVIQPLSTLPIVTYPVIVDGTTQPGYEVGDPPVIILDGSLAGANASGFWIRAGNSTILGLNIQNFDTCAIIIMDNGDNLIESNYLGVNTSGSQAQPNECGVGISGAPRNIIQNNLISGNRGSGVYIEWASAADNIVRGNRIGTDYNGTLALGNGEMGVYLANTRRSVIGGDQPGEGNLISGNLIEVYIVGDDEGSYGDYNQVLGNFIGTDITGNISLHPSGWYNILIDRAAYNQIGGSILGCGPGGRKPGAVSPGGTACPGNLISGGTRGIGIIGISANNNQVLGNFIGTNLTGTLDLGNEEEGIYIEGASANRIGGSKSGDGNLISGNDKDGIFIVSQVDGPQATSNWVQGNWIGTDVTGSQALGNSGCGIYVEHAPLTLIGGTQSGTGNLVSGNTCGVYIYLQQNGGASVLGNHVGTDRSGTLAIGNLENGVTIYESQQVNIGGRTSGAGNVISGNGGHGIYVFGRNSWSAVIASNFIGVDINGETEIGNGGDGVFIEETGLVSVGGTITEDRNLISGNEAHGVHLYNSDNISIGGNLIGTKWNGTLGLGNSGSGIFIEQSIDNQIGGRPDAGNTIAYNQQGGIVVVNGYLPIYGTSHSNEIHFNSIFENQDLGIDLGNNGVTANDLNDPDNGPNVLQNYPLITSAKKQTLDGSVSIWYQLNSKPNSTFLLLFYASPSCNASGFGEGQQYLGGIEVMTAADGWYEFWLPTHYVLPAGWFITGTATDANGNTSEFSACTPITQWFLFYFPMISRE